MKITVWLRREGYTRKRTLRTDYKFENNDDPTMQRFGMALIKAIESGGTDDDEQKGGER